MVWHLIKYWATFFIPVFYSRIQGKNKKNLFSEGPVIIAMNHPNAFTDPIAITWITYPLRVHYMARGDAFKPGIIAWILEQIGIVPIFRLQDAGREGLKKNHDSYRRVNSLLKRNAKIIVFAEGICVQERRLRPLKKGVARMVFGAYDYLKRPDLKIVPVGVNYDNPDKFRSTVFYNVGEPIPVKDFIEEYQQNPTRAHNLLLQRLYPAMKELITHIDNPANDKAVVMAENLVKEDWLKERRKNTKDLAEHFEIVKELTEKINAASENSSPALAEFGSKAESYFQKLSEKKLSDKVIKKPMNLGTLTLRLFVLIFLCPLFLTGMIANFLPLFLSNYITRSFVKTKEFYSSFAIGIGMTIFPLFYIAYFVTTNAFAPNALYAVLICIIFALTGWFCLWYYPFLSDTLQMIRCLRNPALIADLRERRELLISLINKF